MLGTLMRAGDVLDLFTVEEPEWGVTATAQRLGIGKSLAHEALATMTEIGLLQRVGHGRYRLGWRTMSLASVLMRTSGLGACGRPIIRDLAEGRGLIVSLLAWERGRHAVSQPPRSTVRRWWFRPAGRNHGARRWRRRRARAAREPSADRGQRAVGRRRSGGVAREPRRVDRATLPTFAGPGGRTIHRKASVRASPRRFATRAEMSSPRSGSSRAARPVSSTFAATRPLRSRRRAGSRRRSARVSAGPGMSPSG